jgi:hypothetical protein
VMFSAPLIAVTYILGTAAMLAYVPPEKIDLAAPLQQLVQAGFGNSGLGEVLTIVAVCALMLNTITGALPYAGARARRGDRRLHPGGSCELLGRGRAGDHSDRHQRRHRLSVHYVRDVVRGGFVRKTSAGRPPRSRNSLGRTLRIRRQLVVAPVSNRAADQRSQ